MTHGHYDGDGGAHMDACRAAVIVVASGRDQWDLPSLRAAVADRHQQYSSSVLAQALWLERQPGGGLEVIADGKRLGRPLVRVRTGAPPRP